MFRFLAQILMAVTLLLSSFSAWAEINDGIGVVGFQAWKQTRIDEAKAQLEKLTAEIGTERAPGDKKPVVKGPQEVGRLQKSARGDHRLQQAQLNFEIAQELSVNDYFVLYLNQFKDRSAFLEAARKLSAEETAELMQSYQRHLAANHTPDAALPALIPNPSQPTKTARP